MSFTQDMHEVLVTEARFLALRQVRPDFARLGRYYLLLGFITAWVAGVGRYWDNPRADWWQYAGLGSVAYIVVLALVLWILVKPLKPRNWTYVSVLTFVGMTSPPAILYAIPVERFFSLDTAQVLNVWFLAVVATWRVVLLFKYLKHSAKLRGGVIMVAALLPLTVIVVALTVLNLEHVVFQVMAGISENDRSGNDAAYSVLFVITTFSMFAFPLLVVAYLAMIYSAFRAGKSPQSS